MARINIIGAGLAGMSAALTLAEKNIPCRLISPQPSERAQSVLAEGGINAALDTMNEHDSPEEHFEDTVRGGCFLADPNAVDGLTQNAPRIIEKLRALGAPFDLTGDSVTLRSFGGQKKKRTAFAGSSTGKILMTALIDEVRKHEASGLIERLTHHEFIRLTDDGAFIRDSFSGLCAEIGGQIIFAHGGMNGMFPSRTTGTTLNTGDVTAVLFSQGISLANPEMIQYHPTTFAIAGKRCLVTEAARGEGGRLWISRSGAKWYFMEEKYPSLGNLMPRDVVAREMYLVRRQSDTDGEVMLDMTGLSSEVWNSRLADLRRELMYYLGEDPARKPVAVREGIHYFMGGIDVDEHHRTCIPGVYAAGECCAQYHGANRLGGNSMLGAIYGGITAAETAASEYDYSPDRTPVYKAAVREPLLEKPRPSFCRELGDVLSEGLGIIRSEIGLNEALRRLGEIKAANACEENRLALGRAMLLSALERRESRGAHYREDCPGSGDEYRKTTVVTFSAGRINVSFRTIPERRSRGADKA